MAATGSVCGSSCTASSAMRAPAAPPLVWLAQQFRAAPSAEGVAALSRALDATRAQLRALGALPPAQGGERGGSRAAGVGDWRAGFGLEASDGVRPTPAGVVGGRSSLACVGFDTHWSGRAMHGIFFEHGLGADPAHCRVLGEGACDEAALLQVALGQWDAQLQPVPFHRQRHADVVLLNHEVRPRMLGEPEVLGSDLAERLRQRGFRGTVCIVTSLNREAIARVRELPGVDMAWPKGALHADMAAGVLRAVEAKRQLVRSELACFLRDALQATNSAAALQGQSGGSDEAHRTLADLRNAAARSGVPAVVEACDGVSSTMLRSVCASQRVQQVAALAAVSAAARTTVEGIIGTVTDLPADLALVQLAQLVMGSAAAGEHGVQEGSAAPP